MGYRMNLINFCRMCELIERQTPTQAKTTLAQSFSSFSEDGETVIRIICEEYASNNIGVKKARKWIALAFGIFDEEVEEAEYAWMDLAEGISKFVGEDKEDAPITIREFYRLLTMDCSSIDGAGYVMFQENIRMMSALQVKWFLRYWLRTPRNGVSCSTVGKAMADYFSDTEIDNYLKFHKHSIVYRYLYSSQKPPCNMQHGGYIKCSLAKNFKGVFPEKYVIDIKYDGNRYQIHRLEKSVIIFNRKGNVVTEQYPDVVNIVQGFDAHQFILDVEIYPVDVDGNPAEHKLLAKRVHSKDKERAVRECPVKLVVFDVLNYMGEPMIEWTYQMRLAHLKDIPLEYRADMFEEGYQLEAAYNRAISLGFEGVMIKDLDEPYPVGKRHKSLLKYKPPRIELDVVITSAKYGEGKRADVFGSYGISVKSEEGYQQIGSVGTGFSDGDLIMLTTELKKVVDMYEKETFYFLPRIVLEVTGDLISKDAEENWALRFPRVKRIRRDKYAVDCNTIQDVIEMA